jgi:hypothetical protein
MESQLRLQVEETRNQAMDMLHMALNNGIRNGIVQETGVMGLYFVRRRVRFTLPPEEDDSLTGKRGCLKRKSQPFKDSLRIVM